MKIIAIIVAVLVVAIAALLLYAATRPDTFRIERRTSVKAPPEKIYPLIADFRRWGLWSPYEHRDPQMKRGYEGAATGAGAIYSWDGDKNIGSGRMEILEAVPPSKIVIKLDFFSPFEAHNTAEFTMTPKNGETEVTWATYGRQPFIGKLMSLFISMDKMAGKDFEDGLTALKAEAEK